MGCEMWDGWPRPVVYRTGDFSIMFIGVVAVERC